MMIHSKVCLQLLVLQHQHQHQHACLLCHAKLSCTTLNWNQRVELNERPWSCQPSQNTRFDFLGFSQSSQRLMRSRSQLEVCLTLPMKALLREKNSKQPVSTSVTQDDNFLCMPRFKSQSSSHCRCTWLSWHPPTNPSPPTQILFDHRGMSIMGLFRNALAQKNSQSLRRCGSRVSFGQKDVKLYPFVSILSKFINLT